MFGYVRPLKSELRIREYERYRAYYCGLCRAMGDCTGQCSRLTLSYDAVFLASVRCCLTNEPPTVKPIRCLLHPLRRRPAVAESPQLAYCADASALLSYRKLEDDLCDEHGLRRLRARLGTWSLRSAYRRAARRHPALDQAVAEALKELRLYEASPAPHSADVAAELFGRVMRAVFSEGLEGANARIAAEIGDATGRWIYLIDAIDDLREDEKKGRFNPLRDVFADTSCEKSTEILKTALNGVLLSAERAHALMDAADSPELNEIVSNVLYLGLPNTAKTVLARTFPIEKTDTKESLE